MSAKPGADSPSEIMSGDHHVMVDGGEISTPRPNYMRNGLNGNIGSALGIRGAEDVHIRPSIPVIFPGHLRKSVLQVQTSPKDWFALIDCIGSSESVRHIKARLQSQSTDGRCCRLSTGCAGGGFGSWGDNVVWVRLDFSPGLGLHPMTGHQNRTRHPDLNFLYWLWRAVFRSRQEMGQSSWNLYPEKSSAAVAASSNSHRWGSKFTTETTRILSSEPGLHSPDSYRAGEPLRKRKYRLLALSI